MERAECGRVSPASRVLFLGVSCDCLSLARGRHWGSVSTWLGGRGSGDLDSELLFPAARVRFLVQCLEVHAPSPEDSHLGHGLGCCCITDPVVNS